MANEDLRWIEYEAWDETAFREAVISIRHILSSGYGCSKCATNDLHDAVGLEMPYPVHDHI